MGVCTRTTCLSTEAYRCGGCARGTREPDCSSMRSWDCSCSSSSIGGVGSGASIWMSASSLRFFTCGEDVPACVERGCIPCELASQFNARLFGVVQMVPIAARHAAAYLRCCHATNCFDQLWGLLGRGRGVPVVANFESRCLACGILAVEHGRPRWASCVRQVLMCGKHGWRHLGVCCHPRNLAILNTVAVAMSQSQSPTRDSHDELI